MVKSSYSFPEQNYLIRLANADDAKDIAHIKIAAWQVAYCQFMPSEYLAALDPAQNTVQLQNVLNNLPAAMEILLAEYRQQVVGFSLVGNPRYQAEQDTIELWAINVLPQFWHRGVGTQLIQSAIKNAIDNNYKQMQLWCIKGNTSAEAAYIANGFTKTKIVRTTSNLTGYPIDEQLFSQTLNYIFK